MIREILREHRAVGAALLLVLLVGAMMAPAAAGDIAAAAAPDPIKSSVLVYGADGDAVLSTPLAERVREGDPVETLGMAGPAARTYVYVQLAPRVPTSILDPVLSGIVERDEKNGLVTARATVEELGALAHLKGVRQVREVDLPVVASGKVMTAGDAAIRTDALRAQGPTGTGVKVGVISDGVDGLAASQASGDLGPVHVLSDSQGGNEGTAMLEIVHDIAPGADLSFHDHGDSVLGFNQAVDDLVAAGCTVIVDDVAWPREPFFEDGVIATHLEGLLATRPLVYVTAAGNYAHQHFQGPFVGDSEGFQDFSGTGSDRPFLYADVPAGEQLRVVMEWDERFGSSADDFDLYLCDARSGDVLRASTNRQTGTSDPLESITWTNSGADREVAIVALHHGGIGGARTIEVYAYPSSGAEVLADNLVAADSIYGHQAVPDVVAVGAVSASNPGAIEPFSSNGPVTHLFPTTTIIPKPDIVGPDRVPVSGAGNFKTVFVGTSAASPHVGALCALIWSARPDLSAPAIRSALYSSAVDLGATGRDNVYGWGRADGAAMYATVIAPATTPTPVQIVTAAPITPAPTPTTAAIATRSPFGKRYTIGDLAGRTVGTKTTLAPGSGSGSATPGSPSVGPTTDPLKPPTKPFVRWYPSARWATGR
ncbi:MAG: S8 family serine peptidase [Methanospirillum sp.]